MSEDTSFGFRILGMFVGLLIGFAASVISGFICGAYELTMPETVRIGILVGLGLFGLIAPHAFFFTINHLLGCVVGAFDGWMIMFLLLRLSAVLFAMWNFGGGSINLSENTVTIIWIVGAAFCGITGLIKPSVAYILFLPALIIYVLYFKDRKHR